MADLGADELDVIRRAGAALAERFTNRPVSHVVRRLATISSTSSDGTATVTFDGDDDPTAGVRLVAGCVGVKSGDRVIVDSYLGMSIVTGVLAWSLDSQVPSHSHSAADITSGTLPVSRGGTGATSAAGAMGNLAYLGSNITGGTGGDTAAFWRGKGNGFALITSTGQLNGQPSQYGFVVNVVASSEVHQEWWTQSNGAHYRRGGNGSTGAMPGWTRIWDLSSALPVANGGTGATSAAAARSNLGAGTPYSLPAATASTRGGVRVGSGLKVSGDVLSVDNGAYVRASGSYRVFVGSKNVTVSNTTPLLFNDSQYRAIVGRGWNGSGDCILAMNGNWSASHVHVEGVVYNPSTKYLCVMTNEATGAPMQVNYVIFAYNA